MLPFRFIKPIMLGPSFYRHFPILSVREEHCQERALAAGENLHVILAAEVLEIDLLETEDHMAEETVVQSSTSSKPFSILIVNDDPVLARFMCSILNLDNYTVDAAYDGEEALERIGRKSYDLIITDVMMPNIDGFELVRLLRENGIDTPIIMFTVRSDEKAIQRGIEAGISDFIAIPFSSSQLRSVVRRWTMRRSVPK
jgi:CheY-like chemotaxis protein